MLGFTGLYYGLLPHPGPMVWNEPPGGASVRWYAHLLPGTVAGFGCRANRNNAGYDKGDGPRAGNGIE